jgi:hypothetical protein
VKKGYWRFAQTLTILFVQLAQKKFLKKKNKKIEKLKKA